MKNKYIFFTNSLNGGGTEKVVSIVSNYVTKKDKVILVKIDPAKSVYHIDSNVTLVSLWSGNYKSFYRFLLFPFFVFKLYQLVREHKPNFLVSFLPIPNFVNVLASLFVFKRKFITVINERCYPSIAYSSNKFRLYFYKFFIPILYNKADYLFANSVEIIKDLKTNFKVTTPSGIFYNPIGFEIQKSLQNKSKSKKLVMVGRLSKEKDYLTAIKAIEYLNLKNNFELHIYGEGNQREFLHNYIALNKIENFVFLHGFKKNIKDCYSKYDALILSSKTEGFPNVMIEAMANQLPIISSNCLSGPREILADVQEVNIPKNTFYKAEFGLLYNVGDSKALANAISHLYSKSEFEKYQKQSLIRSKKFQTKSVLEKFLSEINKNA